jgi:hypothetical protein
MLFCVNEILILCRLMDVMKNEDALIALMKNGNETSVFGFCDRKNAVMTCLGVYSLRESVHASAFRRLALSVRSRDRGQPMKVEKMLCATTIKHAKVQLTIFFFCPISFSVVTLIFNPFNTQSDELLRRSSSARME